MTVLDALKKENCCGCGCCSVKCPHKAITLVKNEFGFLYPEINTTACTGCGLCRSVCPSINCQDKNERVKVYMAKNPNEKVRARSSSGGVFTSLGETIIENGGVVYGAGYDENFIVRHMRIVDKRDLFILCGSKYVQSDMSYALTQIGEDLKTGRQVLFTGTPCQVEGVKRLYNNYYNNRDLICIDIICHGVPSPALFKDHIDYIENRYGKCSSYRSRSKYEGWHSSFDSFKDEKGRVHNFSDITQSYWMLFKTNLCLRESCYTCPFSTFDRVGDITIGDYWGVEKYHKDWDDNLGTSIVMINTASGETFFERVRIKLRTQSCGENEIEQPHLLRPCEKPSQTEQFWDDYSRRGYAYVANCYGKQSKNRKIKRIIKRVVFRIQHMKYKE